MTKEEEKQIVEAVVEAMHETSEIEMNSIMGMILKLLIELEKIPNPQHRIIFLKEIQKQFEGDNKNNN